MPPKNANLAKARPVRNDEFYTRLSDVENECEHYRDHFKGKVIYCPCDDPRVSNFWRYFADRFHDLGLKRLIATCYIPQNMDLFGAHDPERAFKLEYDGIAVTRTVLAGNGDFRSLECSDVMRQADIVVTNPPFSLIREFVPYLTAHGVGFLIIVPLNALAYKEVFPYIQEGRAWVGYGFVEPSTEFTTPQGDSAGFGNVEWLTNLDIDKRHTEIPLHRLYTFDDYPKYDNYDAVNVDRVEDIPINYAGVMGVPITYLARHNPNQFDIVGCARPWSGRATKRYGRQVRVDPSGVRHGMTQMDTSAILQIDGPIDKTYYIVDGNYYRSVFTRVLIRHKRYQVPL